MVFSCLCITSVMLAEFQYKYPILSILNYMSYKELNEVFWLEPDVNSGSDEVAAEAEFTCISASDLLDVCSNDAVCRSSSRTMSAKLVDKSDVQFGSLSHAGLTAGLHSQFTWFISALDIAHRPHLSTTMATFTVSKHHHHHHYHHSLLAKLTYHSRLD